MHMGIRVQRPGARDVAYQHRQPSATPSPVTLARATSANVCTLMRHCMYTVVGNQCGQTMQRLLRRHSPAQPKQCSQLRSTPVWLSASISERPFNGVSSDRVTAEKCQDACRRRIAQRADLCGRGRRESRSSSCGWPFCAQSCKPRRHRCERNPRSRTAIWRARHTVVLGGQGVAKRVVSP